MSKESSIRRGSEDMHFSEEWLFKFLPGGPLAMVEKIKHRGRLWAQRSSRALYRCQSGYCEVEETVGKRETAHFSLELIDIS